ncbi:hypothetical protein JCM14124_26680 [Humidesulfovibrio idahonensis]
MMRLDIQVFENLHHGLGGLGVAVLHQTGDEQMCSHGQALRPVAAAGKGAAAALPGLPSLAGVEVLVEFPYHMA